jgi:chorismate-pyruvate lyase
MRDTLDSPMTSSPGVTEQKSDPVASPLCYPLDEFYAQIGLALPTVHRLEGAAVPEPYKTLLVHSRDMTPTLEEFYGCKVSLEVLSRERRGDVYFREVLLRTSKGNRPVEFGAIKIHIGLFPPAARRQVLEERTPLGRILAENEIRHSSRPRAFLRIQADSLVSGHFGLTQPSWLYGRRNTISDAFQRPLAEIVEILPPGGVSERYHAHGTVEDTTRERGESRGDTREDGATS